MTSFLRETKSSPRGRNVPTCSNEEISIYIYICSVPLVQKLGVYGDVFFCILGGCFHHGPYGHFTKGVPGGEEGLGFHDQTSLAGCQMA